MTKVEGTPFILVVDSSEGHVVNAVAALRQAGWHAVGTTDPWKAITMLSQSAFSQIILDLDQTGDGIADFCGLLMDDPGLKDLPVIFYSWSAHPQRLPRPVDVCLRKPLNASELTAAVRRFVTWPFPPEETLDPPTRFIRRRRQPTGSERFGIPTIFPSPPRFPERTGS